MKTIYVVLCIIVFENIMGCTNDCGRTDYGVFQTTIYNSDKEELSNVKVAVHPIKQSSFYYNPSLTSIQTVKDYYGAEIIETNELGQIDILVEHSDGTTSCDGPRETYDNTFERVVLFYECAAGELKYQEFTKTNGLFVAGSINKVDSVFIGSDCLK